MPRIIIFGANGMLGKYVCQYLNNESFTVVKMTRNEYDIAENNESKLENLLKLYKNDVIVNCAGIIPQRYKGQIKTYFGINTMFPHLLAKLADKYNCHLIHISTDCVYDGTKGYYTELDKHTTTDIYGISKSLGEPLNATIIRTSIIGESSRTDSLLEWVKSKNHCTINGYTNHKWNGMTCLQLSIIIKNIISTNNYWKGVKHLYSPNSVSKYELISMISQVYNLQIDIKKYETEKSVNRCLKGLYNFDIPDILTQLYELKNWVEDIPVGNYVDLIQCRFCKKKLTLILKLGDKFPLAGGFLNSISEIHNERVYPLTLKFCSNCCLMQCGEVISSDILFKSGYFYYSSMIKTLVSHFRDYAKHLANQFTTDKLIVEIGCNDGVFLRPLKDHGFKIIGVDPSFTVAGLIEDGFTVYNEYFTQDVVIDIIKKYGKADIFLSSNSFAHIDDMNSIMLAVKNLLKNDGYAIIEVHYSRSIIDQLQFDFIYHEHMSYYTVTSFYKIAKIYDMTLEKVEFTSVHGGSIRVYLKNTPQKSVSYEIQELIKKEDYLHAPNTFTHFNRRLTGWKTEFYNLYMKLKCEKNIIYGYGASGRANIFCRYVGINLDGIIDDAQSKIGKIMPVYHQRISKLTSQPDYLIILAWPYAEEIIKKNTDYKGVFIIPLPTIKFINT